MKRRTQIYLTDEQHERLTEIAQATGSGVSEHIRRAIDWYLGTTIYIKETTEMLEDVHPDMSPDQLVGWLLFRWRLRYEGKENGNEEIKAMLKEILEVVKNDRNA